MAKTQRRETPMKIEERKIWGPEREPQVKQTALLASLIFIGQAQGKRKNIKRGGKIEARGLSTLCIFWIRMPSHMEDVFSFACQIKLSCNTGPSTT